MNHVVEIENSGDTLVPRLLKKFQQVKKFEAPYGHFCVVSFDSGK